MAITPQGFCDPSCRYSIQALLSAPNPDDPLADNIAKHWKENEAEALNQGAMLRSAVQVLVSVPLTTPPKPGSGRVYTPKHEKASTRAGKQTGAMSS
jgi:hypothetical protein